MSTVVESPLRRHRLSVEEFHRMGEAGILRAEDRVELIEGELIEMAPIGSKHAAVVDELARLLVLAAQGAAQVRVQNPIRLGADCEPQPDVALLRPRQDRYASALPRAEDVLPNNRLHLYTSPAAGGYLETRSLARPGVLAPGPLPGCLVDLSGLF
jgi:Uma2 family endonuclease